jgi:NAD(P)-dependent dehydrogenase (short-subunit alcohol dehydrogenase family)
VAIASRGLRNLEAAAALLRDEGFDVATVAADLREPAQAARLASAVEDALGAIDVLVNCAGAARRTPPGELTADHWRAAMEAKYFTYVHALDAVLPGMARRGAGAVVNVIGMGGKVASPIHLPGGAANAALMLATAGLAQAFAAQGVRINAVNPGLTATDRLHEGLAAEARAAGQPVEPLLAERARALPMGRIAEPHEIADVVVFLASRRASYVNGAIVSMDGAAVATVV